MDLLKSMKYLLLLLVLMIFSCEPETEVEKGTLSGTVSLENQTDNSGITIAIYNLAELDPEIVSVNNEYPHIGVIINQHTEFDHRLQTPIRATTSDSNGDFEMKDIIKGTYNIVIMKQGWGFKYLYEIEIYKGDNDLTNGIILFEEKSYSGVISENLIFETDHHYIIEDDTTLLPNLSLVIQPGAIIRINPDEDFTIHGSIKAQGTEDKMFWITSNDGFDDLYEVSLLLRDEIDIYHQMEFSPISFIEDDLIEWGKWSYGDTCLLNQVNNLKFQNAILRDAQCGFYSFLTFTEITLTDCNNILSINNLNENQGGIYYVGVDDGEISKSVFLNNFNGVKVKDGYMGKIQDNFLYNNTNGISIWDFSGVVQNNLLQNNIVSDIEFSGNTSENNLGFSVYFNNISSVKGLFHNGNYSYCYFSTNYINNNNFTNSDLFLHFNSVYGLMNMNGWFDLTNNYFNGLQNEQDIRSDIYDQNSNGEIDIIIVPFNFYEIPNIGIR